ncbi:Crp/Fnr family transcriptional regulator [Williamwhitmania taraxaci]|uniref:CRP/FNR family transcriptional regulator, anaerobic regulatory protein n=1 Tax=Williamwhitmania taraxaci TaxID=1640674 RepID=A0A1G6HG16_9BACT|nr:Crp/Fnr family transcriptional regulator [Williamwhitmania taraxaci]SDB93114.1 CRP/FNR family transcriptional regulator, anaerobic regulatory protein [Williamwhitmania taraxaci]
MDKTSCKFCTLKSSAAKKLTDSELETMSSNCAEVHFKAGDTIIIQDALSTNVAYIKSGLVKIHIRGPIKEKIMKIAKAPTYLCLPSTFGDKVNHFSATALEKTTVCFIDVTTFKNFIYQNGDFAYQIITDMSKGELLNFHSLINNAQKQNIGRVADAILFFATEIYNSTTFTLPISRQDLGDLLGITRESASRILTDFHNEKILQIEGKKITILNEPLLTQISEKG